MRSLLTLGLISFALTFCGISDKLKALSGGSGNSNSATTGSNSSSSSPSSTGAEKPKISGAQQAIIDGGTETKWDDQGLSWKLPGAVSRTMEEYP